MSRTTSRSIKATARTGLTLIDPDKSPHGKSPAKWLEEWSKWFLQNNRDDLNREYINSENFVMLRGQMRSYDIYSGGQSRNVKEYALPLVLPISIKRDTIICFPLLCTLSSKNWEPLRKSDLDTDAKLKKDAEKHNDYQLMHEVSITLDGYSIVDWSNYADRAKVKARAVTTSPFNFDVPAGDWHDDEGLQSKKIDGIILAPGEARIRCSGALFLATLESRQSPYILRFRASGVNGYVVHAVYIIQVN